MIGIIVLMTFLALFSGFVVRKKYKKHEKSEKHWDALNTNKKKKSLEELKQDESKYKGFASGGFM